MKREQEALLGSAISLLPHVAPIGHPLQSAPAHGRFGDCHA